MGHINHEFKPEKRPPPSGKENVNGWPKVLKEKKNETDREFQVPLISKIYKYR